MTSPENLASITYIFGYKGQPKAALIEHAAITHTLFAMQSQYPAEETDVYSLKMPFHSGMSVVELFGWFLGGGKLFLMEKENETDPQKILDAIHNRKISHINLAPTLFNRLVNVLDHGNILKLSGLKYLFLSGESIVWEPLRKFNKLKTNVSVVSLYGTAETSIYAHSNLLSRHEEPSTLPGHRPISNTKIYILNFINDKPVLLPVGVPGEICIAGMSLPVWYLKRPELLEENIIKNPFIDKDDVDNPYKRLYRTGEIVHLDSDGIYREEEGNISKVNSPRDLAYVIYTSGSTGKPKGVGVEHCALANLCFWHNNYYSVTSNDHATKYAGFGFDASVWEIFPYLVIGAAVYIVPEEIKLDTKALHRYFQDNGITISFLPTQVCEQFMAAEDTSLRILLTGGDKLRTYTKKSYRLFNNYGPTENTVVTTSFHVTELSANIPIGKPLDNNQIYIMDKYNNLQPIGVPGELCIGGDSLARGYLNNPKLTEEKFIENPFRHAPCYSQSYKLYRTGDLVRWLPDGNIEFLGRIDYQVKIRGFRIELGEIENQLLQIEGIRETVVIARDDALGQKYLCAYIIFNQIVEASSIREFLAKNLPDYMIPSFFVRIDTIPLTPNGKIDTKGLPEPQSKGPDYVAPTNEIEKILAQVWSAALGNEKISIDDNFFEIGGDSIKTILISSKLLKLQLSVTINDFFLYPTIRQLAKHIKKSERTINQETVTGEVELTPILKWYFNKPFNEKHHFSHVVTRFSGDGFDEKMIETVFSKIVEHHDALRMVYEIDKGRMIPRIRNWGEGKPFDLELFDWKDVENIEENLEKEIHRMNRTMELTRGPLVKLGIFKTAKGDYLVIGIHHAVVDGVSWRILMEDFETAYDQISQGEPVTLQAKTDSFKDWALKLNEYADSSHALREFNYWKTIEEFTGIELPAAHRIDKTEKKYKNYQSILMTLDKASTAKLLRDVNFAYTTEINDILLTALGLGVKEWSGNGKILVNLEGHGREGILPGINISRTVGWFTSQYPVLLDMDEGEALSYFIKNAKETLRRIPHKGIGYGILKYLTSPEKKEGTVFRAHPQISFNYLGQLDSANLTVSFSPEFDMDCAIDINGSVGEEGLTLSFSYNGDEYDGTDIEKLADTYKSNLLRIIDHCLSKKEKELTPSDLGCSQLPVQSLHLMREGLKEKIGCDTEIEAIYPLTSFQEEMFYSTIANRESYLVQFAFSLPAPVSTGILEEAFNKVIERHAIFRTVFIDEKTAGALQVVLKKAEMRIALCDVSQFNTEEKRYRIDEIKEKDRRKGFDLSIELPLRITRILTGETVDQLIWSVHHIGIDGWCLGIIINDLLAAYDCFVEGRSLPLEPVPPYRNYIQWLQHGDMEEGFAYWRGYLSGYQTGLPTLSSLGNRVKTGGYRLEEHIFTLDESLSEGLARVASESKVTLNTLFQVLWGIELQRYLQTEDALFGSIVSGRSVTVEGIEKIVGLMINIVPVRIKQGSMTTLSELLKAVQDQSAQSKPYENLPLDEVLSRASLNRGVIDSLLFFENYPTDDENTRNVFSGQTLRMELIENHEQIDYPFCLYVMPGKTIWVRFQFNALVFEREFIENMALNFEQIVKAVIAKPDLDLTTLSLAK